VNVYSIYTKTKYVPYAKLHGAIEITIMQLIVRVQYAQSAIE